MNIQRKNLGTISLCIYIILILLFLLFVSGFFSVMSDKVYDERCTHLNEINEKASQVLTTVGASNWDLVLNYRNHIYRHAPKTEEELVKTLNEFEEDLVTEGISFVAFDDNVRFYDSDGNIGRWSDPSLLLDGAPDRQILITTLPGRELDTEQLVFLAKIQQPIELDGGRRVTHLALVQEMVELKEKLDISGFEDESGVCIVNGDGVMLCTPVGNAYFMTSYNVLQTLEKAEFLHVGSTEYLRDSIDKKITTAMEIKYDSEEYFLSVTSVMESENWYIILLIPTSVLSAGMDYYMHFVIFYFTIIAVILIIFISFTIFIALKFKSHRELMSQKEEANILLNKAAEEARAANRAKSVFLSHMSHDIRTPINGIMGMTEIALKNQGNPAKQEDCLKKIWKSSQHLLSLINNVLEMSRIESGKTEISHEPMNIYSIIEECDAIVCGQLQKRDILWKKEIGNIENPNVFGDELHLKQILVNILGNAIKFTPDGKSISFNVIQLPLKSLAEKGQATFRFEVTDQGIGMSEEFLENIFDAFAQETHPEYCAEMKGTGLGMAITKEFVDLMGGKINVTSQLGQGTTFEIALTFDINTQAYSCSSETEEEVSLEGMRLLLVDDNELNVEIFEDFIAGKGIILTKAENGKEAVEIFENSQEGEFDLILMDIMMPVMDGLEAAKRIRMSGKKDSGSVPIVAMTANAFAEDMEKTRAAGMNDHLTKPLNAAKTLKLLEHYGKKERKQ